MGGKFSNVKNVAMLRYLKKTSLKNLFFKVFLLRNVTIIIQLLFF